MWQADDEIAGEGHDAEGCVIEVDRLSVIVGECHAQPKEFGALSVGGAVSEDDDAVRGVEFVAEGEAMFVDERCTGVGGVERSTIEHAIGGEDDAVREGDGAGAEHVVGTLEGDGVVCSLVAGACVNLADGFAEKGDGRGR
mgnify:CR=1 FL=1